MEPKIKKHNKKSMVLGLILSLVMPAAVGAYYKIDRVDVTEGANCGSSCANKSYTVYVTRDTEQNDKVVSVSQPVYNGTPVNNTYYQNGYYPNSYTATYQPVNYYSNNYPQTYTNTWSNGGPAWGAGSDSYYQTNGAVITSSQNNYYNNGSPYPSARPHGTPAW